MKICYDYQIFFHQEFGGVSRYHIEIANLIKNKEGCLIKIPCLWSNNDYLREHFDVYKLPASRFTKNRITYFLGKMYSIINLLKNDYDIIHPTWVDPYIYKYKNNAKIVITIHDMIHELFWRGYADNEINRKKQAIYSADKIITISNNTKKDILRIYPDIPEEKIQVIYHGTSHLPKPNRPLSFTVPNRYILFVGRRGDYKRGMYVVKALSDFLKNNKEISILFLGGGKFSYEELLILQKYGLTNSIIQKDVTDAELAYLYKHAICFVYPSLYEGFGLPILEAFENDCPVVCSNNSSLPEVGGEAALYFDNENSSELVNNIEKLCFSEDVREDCIRKGKERVKMFTWEKCAEQTYRVYLELIK